MKRCDWTETGASAGDYAIRVEGVGKCYHLYDSPLQQIRHALFPFGGKQPREFWALRNISFEIMRGETFGVVGRNGSGKSTLLQLIAGTLMPSEGAVRTNGRIAALLELGSGFNPNFTGLENIYLNGAILGVARQEIERRLDDILAFADIGTFIDQPVKTYSSGMFVRLAFAVQICLDPDIMIVDEALAVGDIFFRQKCYARLQELREQGCAIMLVSHATTEVEQFCERAIVLDRGGAHFIGGAMEAIKHYYLVMQGKQLTAIREVPPSSLPGEQPPPHPPAHIHWPADHLFMTAEETAQVSNGWARCTRYVVCDSSGSPCNSFEQGQLVQFFYEFEIQQPMGVPLAGVVIQNDKGVVVHGKGSLEHDAAAPGMLAAGTILKCVQRIELCLAPGEYTFELGLATIPAGTYGNKASLDHLQLFQDIVRICHLPQAGTFCVTFRQSHEGAQLTHHGIADLPGSFTFIGES